jgi:hypothetical protein
MSITELLASAKKSAITRTPEERKKILIEAKIITKKGNYNSKYFSKETIKVNKQNIAINVH